MDKKEHDQCHAILAASSTTILRLLIRKGIITKDEYEEVIAEEVVAALKAIAEEDN